MEEAVLVFEKFVLLDEFNTASIRTDKKHGNKVGMQSESKKSILDKFRISIKRNKPIKSNEPNKENKNDYKPRIRANVHQNDKGARNFKQKTSSKNSKVRTQEGNEEKAMVSSRGRQSPPTFWLIAPPPPLPSPRFLEYQDNIDLGFNGGELGSEPEENDDDTDDVDGESDKFEEVSDEEKKRRVEEVVRKLDEVVEKHFGPKTGNPISRSSSSASISNLGQHLINDRSYKFFKNEVNSFIRSHNDNLLNQIGLLFSVARSAIKKVGLNTSEGQEVSRNAMRFYEDAYEPLVSQAGGLGSLVRSETQVDSE